MERSNCACDTALVAKIKIGMYSGSVNKDNNIPEFLTPTISEAPIAPIRLKLGVANKRVNINIYILSISKKRAIPISGDSRIVGRPVRSQCAVIFANNIRDRE